jgi:hypothetical protein
MKTYNEKLRVKVIKHTGIEEARACIESTSGREARAGLHEIYRWEHSITRSQIFSVQLIDCFSFVSVHLVRHVTTVPFVTSRRIDRGGDGTEDRYTLVNHRFLANAEALLNMARRRLCFQASPETRETMIAIKEAVRKIDPDLAHYMVPNCAYRGGICPEPKPCGMYIVRRYYGEDEERSNRGPRHPEGEGWWEART